MKCRVCGCTPLKPCRDEETRDTCGRAEPDLCSFCAYAHFQKLPTVDLSSNRVCAGCGCTDANACVELRTGERCRWVNGADFNICSFCAAIAVRMARLEEAQLKERHV